MAVFGPRRPFNKVKIPCQYLNFVYQSLRHSVLSGQAWVMLKGIQLSRAAKILITFSLDLLTSRCRPFLDVGKAPGPVLMRLITTVQLAAEAFIA